LAKKAIELAGMDADWEYAAALAAAYAETGDFVRSYAVGVIGGCWSGVQ